jgi:hypothetical protein
LRACSALYQNPTSSQTNAIAVAPLIVLKLAGRHSMSTLVDSLMVSAVSPSISEASAGAPAKMPLIRWKHRVACHCVADSSGSTGRSPGASRSA